MVRYEGDWFMKKMNFVFAGVASLITLGVLANCSSRFDGMGEMKSRRTTCEKYNEWARKAGKPEVCQAAARTLGRGQQRPDDTTPINRPIYNDGLDSAPSRPAQPAPVRPAPGTPPVTPPAVPPVEPGTPPGTPPVNPPAPPAEPGTPPPSTPPTTPPAPPAPSEPGAPQPVTRAKFMQVFERDIQAQMTFVKGITVSSGKEGSDVVLAFESVVAIQNDAGVDENKSLFLKKSVVAPFSSATIPVMPQVELKNNAGQVQDLGGQITVYSTCNEAACTQINLILQFFRPKGSPEAAAKPYAFGVCAIETGRGIKRCNFAVKSFNDAQLQVPTTIVGDVSGAPGDVSGAPGDTSGAATTQPDAGGSAEQIESHRNMVNAAKVAKDVVIEQARLADLAVSEINAAKTAGDLAKAEAALVRAEAAAKAAIEAAQQVVAIKDDLTAKTDVAAALLAEAEELSIDASAKAHAVSQSVEAAKAVVAGMKTPAAAPGDTSGGAPVAPAAPVTPGDERDETPGTGEPDPR